MTLSATSAQYLSPSSSSSSIPPSPRLSIVTSSCSSLSSLSTFSDQSNNFVHLPTPLPSPSHHSSPLPPTASSKTTAFFASPYSRPPTPPPPPPADPEATPTPESFPEPSFFAAPPLASPPPSWKHKLAPLSRILPGRHGGDDDDDDDDDENRVEETLARLFPARYRTKQQPPPPPPESLHIRDAALTSSPESLHHPHPHLPSPPASDSGALSPGSSLTSPDPDAPLALALLRPLGSGAFSAVWLARPSDSTHAHLSRSLSQRKPPAASIRRRITGVRPKVAVAPGDVRRGGSVYLRAGEGEGGGEGRKRSSRLVAVKLTLRRDGEVNERTRVSFVREVEVLRHISHPSIISYLASFSTPSHHVLVLEYVGGGELFDVVNDDEKHAQLTESTLWRMWSELCGAVGWMHSVGLVHRDIKLENILLTQPFPFPADARAPLIKLSDFGLSRFVDLADPLLTTRCGSESYAAPEVVMGRQYDGRETDAWALGVVLYAVATRRLPFDGPAGLEREGGGGGHRRGWAVRIARGEYEWPALGDKELEGEGVERRGTELAGSRGVRAVVGRLLVRDARRRARVEEVGRWEDVVGAGVGSGGEEGEGDVDSDRAEEDWGGGEEGWYGSEGVLVDGDSIGREAREEVH